MAENKTKPTRASVDDYIAARADERQAAEGRVLVRMMRKATGAAPVMWGPSIVGFGSFRYAYPSGRTGESPLAAFAIRGREFVVYVDAENDEQRALLAVLGKHRMTKICLYFRSLAELDVDVLQQLIVNAIVFAQKRHGLEAEALRATGGRGTKAKRSTGARASAKATAQPKAIAKAKPASRRKASAKTADGIGGSSSRGLFVLPGAVERSKAVDAFLAGPTGQLGALARMHFDALRRCGPGVQELMHDGQATACLGDAAFAYVSVHAAHVNLGFFHGAALKDPSKLLQGKGKFMRHVQLVPGSAFDRAAIAALIEAAYRDVKARVAAAKA